MSAVEELVADAQEAGVSISALCRDGGVSRASFYRWRSNPPKQVEQLNSMQRSLTRRTHGARKS
jgi:transposase-like protein